MTGDTLQCRVKLGKNNCKRLVLLPDYKLAFLKVTESSKAQMARCAAKRSITPSFCYHYPYLFCVCSICENDIHRNEIPCLLCYTREEHPKEYYVFKNEGTVIYAPVIQGTGWCELIGEFLERAVKQAQS